MRVALDGVFRLMKLYSIVVSLFLVIQMSIAQPAIEYTLGMSRPSSHLFEVEVRFSDLPEGKASLDVRLPVWRPGRYNILDLAGGVQDFAAEDGKRNPRTWEKIDKSLWRISIDGARNIVVRYRVFANEFNLRTRGLNDEHAFVDGAALFMYAEEYRRLPITIHVKPYEGWHVTTGLDGSGSRFTAPDYDYLVDCPIEIGTQEDFEFEVEGIPHVLSIFGKGNWDADTLVRDISKIVQTTREFWGTFPYKRYVFLMHCTPTSGGGTEHLNSTIMGVRPFIFKNAESYRSFLGLVAHEYFHTWNIKQLRPAGLKPYDYTKENYSRELWIAEGTTSYYDELLLVRAGFQSSDKYLEQIASAIQVDRQRPGNTEQSLAESSFDAWVKYWRSNPQAYNYETDYYSRGAAVSMVLDLELRAMTGNRSSLDDVLREMWKRFPLDQSGYTVEDFRKVAEGVAGGSLERFFGDHVFGTKPLPWERMLGYAGLEVTTKDTMPKTWIGLGTSDVGERTIVNRVVAGSPAAEAGLDLGDEILALNGYRVRSADITNRVQERKHDEKVTLTFFRNDRIREITVAVDYNLVPAYTLKRSALPTEMQKDIYQRWLSTTWK